MPSLYSAAARHLPLRTVKRTLRSFALVTNSSDIAEPEQPNKAH